MDKRTAQIARASIISIAGNALLATSKIVIGALAGSLAVMADGFDSASDVLISVVSLIAVKIMDKPSDAEHPYGHGRAETIATTILAFVIVFAGAQLVLSTLHNFFSGETRALPDPIAIWVILISICGKLLLALNQFAVGKKTGSALLIANGKNMRNDVLISITVLIGLVLTFILKLPILDTVIALLLGLWIVKTGVSIFFEVNTELMDGNKDKSLYTGVFEAVKSVDQACNPHRVRIRNLANRQVVDLDIEVDGTMPVSQAHEIAQKVEAAIKIRIPTVYDVMVHVEPIGVHEADERWGWNEDSLREENQTNH